MCSIVRLSSELRHSELLPDDTWSEFKANLLNDARNLNTHSSVWILVFGITTFYPTLTCRLHSDEFESSGGNKLGLFDL